MSTISYISFKKISWENVIKDPSIFLKWSCYINVVSIITTFSLDYVLIPLGEHWCWSLVGLKDRTYRFPTDEPESPNSFPVMAWIALLSSCLLSINKTNQFLISIADVWKNNTWLYHSHGCFTEQNFPTFHLLTDDSPPAPPFYLSINFFASHEWFSVKFNFLWCFARDV